MLNIDDRLLDRLNESEIYLCLQILKRMQQNRMTAWPSIETIAKDCRWNDKTTKKWRSSLVDKGVISMTQKPGKPNTYRFKWSGFGVYMPMQDAEFEEKEEGGQNLGGVIFAKEGGQNLPPELVNKELVNSLVSEKETKCLFSFDEFWSTYDFRKGSKSKAEASYKKLSAKDVEEIRDTLPLYLLDTVTSDILRGEHFRPMRKYPEFYLSGKIWKTYVDVFAAQKKENDETFPEHTERYNFYLERVTAVFPNVIKSTKQLSKAQFVRYKTEYYVQGKSFIGKDRELKEFEKAHRDMNDNPDLRNKYVDVFSLHCERVAEAVKTYQ